MAGISDDTREYISGSLRAVVHGQSEALQRSMNSVMATVTAVAGAVARVSERVGEQEHRQRHADRPARDESDRHQKLLDDMYKGKIAKLPTFEGLKIKDPLVLLRWQDSVADLAKDIFQDEPPYNAESKVLVAKLMWGKVGDTLKKEMFELGLLRTEDTRDPELINQALAKHCLTDTVRAAKLGQLLSIQMGLRESWKDYAKRVRELTWAAGVSAEDTQARDAIIQGLKGEWATLATGLENSAALMGTTLTYQMLNQRLTTVQDKKEGGALVRSGVMTGGGAATVSSSGGAVPMELDAVEVEDLTEMLESGVQISLTGDQEEILSAALNSISTGTPLTKWNRTQMLAKELKDRKVWSGKSSGWSQDKANSSYSSAKATAGSWQQTGGGRQQQTGPALGRRGEEPRGFKAPWNDPKWPLDMQFSLQQLYDRHKQGQCYACGGTHEGRWFKCPTLEKKKQGNG
jgi:hypothetical protein